VAASFDTADAVMRECLGDPASAFSTPTPDGWVPWKGTPYETPDEVEDTQEETVALAVESARRWARRTDLSPELRLRRIWTVLEAALR
jgi:hypothetical protein